jgi:hypothetical protein
MATNTNVDPQDQAQLNILYQKYIDLLQTADDLTFAQAKNKADAARSSGTLNKEIERLNKYLDETVRYTDSLTQGFQETLAELKGQNAQLNIGKSAFKNLANIASDLNYFQKGISDQTEKQFKLQQEKIKKGREELVGIRERLGKEDAITGEFKYQQQGLLNHLQSKNKLTLAQKKLKDELEKEKALLEAANDAIENGIPILQREYDISKQIYTVRKDLGGLAMAAAEVVSKYGGSLAQFLNVNEAIDSVKEYNHNLIDGALKSKATIDAIKQVEEDRTKVLQKNLRLQIQVTQLAKADHEARNAAQIIHEHNLRLAEIHNKLTSGQITDQNEINKLTQEESDLRKDIIRVQGLANRSVNIQTKLQQKQNDLTANELQTKQDLVALDEKEAQIKKDAIASVDRLGNKFRSLGVLVKGMGEGLLKAFKDPVVLLTTLVDIGFKANSQVVELGKSFGVSARAAENMRQDMAQFARGTGDTFINTDRLLKAQSELSKELGIAVRFSNEELATFSKLTELTGLTAQEAGKLALASKAAGIPTEDYADSIREAAFYAQQSTGTHFDSKEILQDVAKLSAGILVKFQGNPKALGEAVVQAKKLGLTLDQIDKVGESLLQWESSIENELKAELLTGKELNMERARAAALSGDQLTLTREIADQVGSLEDYQNMNVLAQRSLAEAFGLSRDEMAEMLMKQEAINRYGDKAAQLNKEQLEDMERQGLSVDEYLKKQEQQRTAQQKFQDAIVKLQDIFGNLVAGPVGQLLDALANMVEFVMKIFGNPVVKFFFDIIAKTAELLSDVASSGFGQWAMGLTAVAILLPQISSGLAGIGGSILNVGKSLIGMGKSAMSGITSLFGGNKPPVPGPAPTPPTVPPASPAGNISNNINQQTQNTMQGANNMKPSDDGTNIRKKLQNIARGIKSFANTKVLLGALNLIPSALGLTAMIPGAVGAKMISNVDGDSFEKAMKGIAKGIKYLGDKNLFAGVGNLVVASVGLTAMIPGAIGAKLISLVDGDAFQKTMKGIAKGITYLGDKNVFAGVGNLIVASVGLTAMIPGAIGAKLISLIDGDTFHKTMKGIAKGIEAFGNKNLVFGSLNLIAASIGLTAMIPGVIGAKMISLVDGDAFQKTMKGIAKGIEAFGNRNLLFGSLNLIVASLGLTAMIPGAIGAKMISLVDGKAFQKTMTGLANGIEAFGTGKILLGAGAMILAAVGLTAMIPGAIGAKMISLVDGEKFEESMYGLSYGIESFASAKVAIGSLSMILAAVGLTAMIPGAIGAKLISLVDGEKFENSVKGIANGIAAFGTGKVLIGAGAMVVAAVGLTAMIPGAVGAKLISLINGEKFEESMYGIAYGIESFASAKVLGGSVAMILAGIGLTAMIPGVLAAKLISLVDGDKFEKSMVGIAKGIEGFFDKVSYGTIIKAAAAIALLGASLIPAAYAINMFGDVEWESMAKAGVALGGLAAIGYVLGKASESMLKGALAIGVLGVSLIPTAIALKMFTDISWEDMAKAGVALVGLGIAGAAFGSFLPLMLMGAIGIAALGTALIPFALALNIMAPTIEKFVPLVEAFGNVITKVFGGIATVVTAAANGIATIFGSLQDVDVVKLLAIGPALMGVGAGLAALGAGNVIDAIGSFFAGDPAEKIAAIAASGEGLQQTSTALQTTSAAIAQLNASLASLDVSKLFFIGPALMMIGEGLKSLSGGGIGDALGSLLTGDPIEKLERLAAIGDRLKDLPSVFQTVVSSITQLNTSLSSLDLSKLDAIGPAITKIGIGLASLGVGNAIDSISSLFAGDPIEKLERLAATSDGLQTASSALQSIAIALMGVSAALTTIDVSKLESLSEFESNKSSKSIFSNITDFFSSPVEKTNETGFAPTPVPTPIPTPIKTTNETITNTIVEGGKEKGIEAPTINAGGIDLTPMVNAINEVKAAVTNLQNRPVKLYMDSREITARQLQANNSI